MTKLCFPHSQPETEYGHLEYLALLHHEDLTEFEMCVQARAQTGKYIVKTLSMRSCLLCQLFKISIQIHVEVLSQESGAIHTVNLKRCSIG